MGKTALIVVDMLRDFTDPKGLVFYPENLEVLPRIRKVLDLCREKGCVIIFLQHANRAGKPDHRIQNLRPNCIEGTWGDEIDPMLPVLDTDYVVKKRRYSGFFGTDLDLILRLNGVDSLVIVGTKTNCCVRATVTDAFYYDYNPIVIRECVATNSDTVNEVHLEDIRKYFGEVISMDELKRRFEAGEL